MKILGIESSCDETAASVLEIKGKNIKVLSNVVSSQIKLHKKYGGVVPEIAARKHAEVIFDIINKSLSISLLRMEGLKDIDLIAVTNGPGLATSLRVGVLAAQSVAMLVNKPLVGINHIEAHLLSPFLPSEPPLTHTWKVGEYKRFPALGLIVSGGHTELILMRGFGKYKIIGETRDDAVGEAFDKVAKMLGLGYPGGPEVSREAKKMSVKDNGSNIRAFTFPRPMINSKDFDFSFSGLKTAVLYAVKKMSKAELKKMTPVICAEFQNAAIEVLIYKTLKAAEKYKAEGFKRSLSIKSILVGGGVSANLELRNQLWSQLHNSKIKLYFSPMEYTGDNAVMIAFAGYKKWQRNKKDEKFKLKVEANLRI